MPLQINLESHHHYNIWVDENGFVHIHSFEVQIEMVISIILIHVARCQLMLY